MLLFWHGVLTLKCGAPIDLILNLWTFRFFFERLYWFDNDFISLRIPYRFPHPSL